MARCDGVDECVGERVDVAIRPCDVAGGTYPFRFLEL